MSSAAPALGVLFDLDGTLVDSLPTVAAAMARALEEFGFTIEVEAVIPLIGAPMPTLAAELTGVTPEVAEQMNERYLQLYYDEFIATTRPLEGATALLDRLVAADIPLGVVTNKNEHGGKLMVEIQGWQEYFDVVVGRDTTPRPKPWPDGTLFALEALGVSPEAGALVGDTEFDMQAGLDAGLRYRVGLLGARTADRLEQAGATHVASELAAVGPILLGGVREQVAADVE